MGVAQYTWATSPLRRYVDLVNQWQIIACVRHARMAPLSAPFKPKDATLFSIISSFDTAYAAYGGFQTGIERFWTLRWLQQQDVRELDAAVLKDGLVRADTLPLVFKAAGCDVVRAEKVTGFPLVPTMAAMILNMKDLPAGSFPHLRYISNTAAALPP